MNISFLFLVIGGVLFLIFFFTNSSSNSVFTSQSLQCTPSHSNKTTLQIPRDELEEALNKASTDNKTVIIAVVNGAYAQGVPNMLDIFLEGFWAGEGTRELVKHLMIVAVDQTAYKRCLFRGLHCYQLVTEGVDFTGEQVFMNNDFVKMMWRRTLLLNEILKKGYNFIFTDTDVIWLRNPFTILSSNKTEDLDIQFSVDNYNGNSSSLLNPINTGFYFVRSNNKTITLLEKWYNLKDNSSGLKEQDVLQSLIWQGALTDLGLKFRFLDTHFFSGFCQDSKDVNSVITIHANCCRFISAKVADLSRVLQEWGRTRVTHDNKTSLWSPHKACKKSWKTNP